MLYNGWSSARKRGIYTERRRRRGRAAPRGSGSTGRAARGTAQITSNELRSRKIIALLTPRAVRAVRPDRPGQIRITYNADRSRRWRAERRRAHRRASARVCAAASARHGRGSTRRCSSTATSTASSRKPAASSSAACRGDSGRGARARRPRPPTVAGAAGAVKRAAADHAPASPPRTAHTRTWYSAPHSSSSTRNRVSLPEYTYTGKI